MGRHGVYQACAEVFDVRVALPPARHGRRLGRKPNEGASSSTPAGAQAARVLRAAKADRRRRDRLSSRQRRSARQWKALSRPVAAAAAAPGQVDRRRYVLYSSGVRPRRRGGRGGSGYAARLAAFQAAHRRLGVAKVPGSGLPMPVLVDGSGYVDAAAVGPAPLSYDTIMAAPDHGGLAAGVEECKLPPESKSGDDDAAEGGGVEERKSGVEDVAVPAQGSTASKLSTKAQHAVRKMRRLVEVRLPAAFPRDACRRLVKAIRPIREGTAAKWVSVDVAAGRVTVLLRRCPLPTLKAQLAAVEALVVRMAAVGDVVCNCCGSSTAPISLRERRKRLPRCKECVDARRQVVVGSTAATAPATKPMTGPLMTQAAAGGAAGELVPPVA